MWIFRCFDFSWFLLMWKDLPKGGKHHLITRLCGSQWSGSNTDMQVAADECLQLQWPHTVYPLTLYLLLVAPLSSAGLHWDMIGYDRSGKNKKAKKLFHPCDGLCTYYAHAQSTLKRLIGPRSINLVKMTLKLALEKSWKPEIKSHPARVPV